jgi:outer membrane immunogenic protein
MDNRLALAAVAIFGAVLPTVAIAADSLTAAAPGSTWTGCYAGVNVGYAHGDNDALDAPFVEGPFAGSGASWNSTPPAPYETIGADDESAIGGGELGCDYEVPLGGVSMVIGAAADISALGLSGEGTSAVFSDTHTSFDAGWAATLRGRLGVAASPQLLIYATGGYAAAGIDVRAFDLSTSASA